MENQVKLEEANRFLVVRTSSSGFSYYCNNLLQLSSMILALCIGKSDGVGEGVRREEKVVIRAQSRDQDHQERKESTDGQSC